MKDWQRKGQRAGKGWIRRRVDVFEDRGRNMSGEEEGGKAKGEGLAGKEEGLGRKYWQEGKKGMAKKKEGMSRKKE